MASSPVEVLLCTVAAVAAARMVSTAATSFGASSSIRFGPARARV